MSFPTGGVPSGAIGDGRGSLSPANDFAISADTCVGKTLAAAGTCQITIQFTPPAGSTGTETASLQLNASPGGTPSSPLSGISFTPAVLAMQAPAGFGGFGNVALGSSSSFQFTLTNSGTQQAGTPSITTNNPQFTISSLGNCNAPVTTTCAFNVTFTPTAPPGSDSVTISATSTPGGTATYGPTTGTGTGAVLSLGPSSWNTTLTACATTTQNFTITNTGNIATTSAITVTFAGAQSGAFTVGAYSCTGDLQPTIPCTIPVSFACPSADPTGYEGIGTLSIDAGGVPAAATASLDVGAGIAISPNPATFGGPVTPGNSVTQLFTVTNFTGATMTKAFTGYTATGSFAAEYAATDVSCVGKMLAAGGTCQFNVKYSAPVGAAGLQSSTLNVNGPPFCGASCFPTTLATTAMNATEQ